MNSPKGNSNDTARWLETWFYGIVDGRSMLSKSWYENLAMIYGHQHTSFNQIVRIYTNYARMPSNDRLRLTFNKIRSIMEARAAFILGDLETLGIVIKSDTEDHQDRLAALTAQQVAQAFWQQEKLATRIPDTWEWTKPCGISFGRLYFDPTWGRVMGLGSNGQALREGIIRYKIESPFAVAVDPDANDWSEVRKFGVASLINFDDAAKIYGDVIDFTRINPSQFTLAPTQHYEMVKLLNDPGIGNAVYSNIDANGKIKRLVKIEYWEAPSSDFPAGRHIVEIGQRTAVDGTLELYDPETNDWDFPIEPFFEWKEAGSIYSETPVSEMREIQEQYNDVVSKMFDRSKMPDLYAFPRGGRWPSKFKSAPVLTGTFEERGGPPQYIEGGRIRPDYQNLTNLCTSSMEEIAGVTQLQTGTPSPYMAGRLGYAINESKRQVLTRTSNNFKQSVTNLIRKYLRMVNKYYTEERIMSFIGEGDRREVVRFIGKDIGRNYTVNIRLETALDKADPTAVMQITASQVFQAMLMKNPKRLKDVVYEIAPKLAHKIFYANTDIAVAEDENFSISQGQIVQVHTTNDDDAHIETHGEMRKSDALLSWPEQFVQNLDQHIISHEMQKDAKLRRAAYIQGQQNFLMGNGGGSPPKSPGTPSTAKVKPPTSGGGMAGADEMMEAGAQGMEGQQPPGGE